MNKFNKKTIWILGAIILVAASVYAWNYGLNSLGSSLCENQFIQSTDSPDGSKKVVTFSTDCGATSDWSIHASVLSKNENINDESVGNALRISSNQGRAWPKDEQGRPIIRTVWTSPSSATLQHSSNADIFYQRPEVENVEITLESLTN